MEFIGDQPSGIQNSTMETLEQWRESMTQQAKKKIDDLTTVNHDTISSVLAWMETEIVSFAKVSIGQLQLNMHINELSEMFPTDLKEHKKLVMVSRLYTMINAAIHHVMEEGTPKEESMSQPNSIRTNRKASMTAPLRRATRSRLPKPEYTPRVYRVSHGN